MMTTISNRLVHHSQYSTAHGRIARIHKMHRTPARPENLRLFGASGVGKSTVLRAYRDLYPPVISDDRTVIPVLYCIVPPMPTQRSLLTELLRGLGIRNPDSGTAVQQTSRVLALTKGCRVELILVDEGQHFIDRGQERTQSAVADLLKVVFDAVAIPAVLAGAPRMEKLFTVNSQLRRRFTASYTIRPFNLDDLFAPFRGFIHSIAADFQDRNRNWLASPETARLLFYASDGIPGNVVDILRFLADLDSPSQVTTLADLSQAFRHAIWESPTKSANPFSKGFRMTRLTQPGEPFEPSLQDGDNHAAYIGNSVD